MQPLLHFGDPGVQKCNPYCMEKKVFFFTRFEKCFFTEKKRFFLPHTRRVREGVNTLNVHEPSIQDKEVGSSRHGCQENAPSPPVPSQLSFVAFD